MRDITDFSPKASGSMTKNKGIFEDALREADADILNFKEARSMGSSIPRIKGKTTNKADFLTRDRKAFSNKTNATKELLESHKMNEQLMCGSSEEDFENEVLGEFGREILQVCIDHGITGEMVYKAFDILKNYLGSGKDLDVEAAMNNFGASDDVEGEDVEDEEVPEENEEEESSEEMEESFKSISEMTRSIRKRIAEKRVLERKLGRKF